MKLYIRYVGVCGSCGRNLNVDLLREPVGDGFRDIMVLKCLTEGCEEFNKPYHLPSVELEPYIYPPKKA